VSNRGFALVTMLMVVSVVGMLTAGSLILSVTNLRLTRNDATASQATGVAQAGSAYWRAELVSLYMHMINNFSQYADEIDAYNENNPSNPITCGNFMAIGVDLDRDGSIEADEVTPGEAFPPIAVPVGGQTGQAVVTFDVRGSAIVLDSRGSVNGARGRMRDEFRVTALDMWNNAVFAGNTAANATVRGRAQIRGSVHVLGEGLTSSDMALDISGSSGVGNTYKNLTGDVDPTGAGNPMRLTTNNPPDLCATLRVKRGYVNVAGSAQVGFAESTNPDPFIDNMRGIFTNDGFVGGTLDSNVFSENGMDAAYDAGNTFQFPYLDDLNPETNVSWRDGMTEHALRLSVDPALDDRSIYPYDGQSTAVEGEIYLTNDCFDTVLFEVPNDGTKTAFYLRHGTTASFSCAKKRKAPAGGVDETLAEVIWNVTPNELYVGGTSGVINLRGGNLNITAGSPSGKLIGYRGEGIFFAEDMNGAAGGVGGTIQLDINFLPVDGYAAVVDEGGGYNGLSVSRRNTYPATAVLALVADNTLVTDGAQKKFTVAVYAQDNLLLKKQDVVAGSIVTPEFDAGTNVPTVLYVPNLAERLSDLLPGTSSRNFAVSNVSFSRR
jgi:type II secretory pathway pseudopilin PulG